MPDTSPTWGDFVTHYDSTGQASTMAAALSPDNTMLTLLFDRMVISLQGEGKQHAASVVLAGHYSLMLPDEFPLAGFQLVARGIVLKSHDANAVLTVSIGERVRTQEWPTIGKLIGPSGSKGEPPSDIEESQFNALCFTAGEHFATGDPPVFQAVPPLTIAIAMHARRRSAADSLQMHLESIDISMLRFH